MARRVDPVPHRRTIRLAVALCGAVLVWPAEAAVFGKPRGPEAGPVQPMPKPEPQFPLNAQWTLVEMNGRPVGGDQPSFTLDDKLRATGFAGCNTYSLTLYPGRGQKLLAGAIARTRNTCDKASLMLETSFLIALHSVPVWRLENGELIIKSTATSLRFRRGI